MKEHSNIEDIDILIRDLDTLGIQDELELKFVCIHSPFNLSTTIRDREYATCLAYNDIKGNGIDKELIFNRDDAIDNMIFHRDKSIIDSFFTIIEDKIDPQNIVLM